jgi:hypothetical protein
MLGVRSNYARSTLRREGESIVTTDHVQTQAERDADEAIRRRRLADPAVQAKVREIQESIRRGDDRGPGIGAEELPDFLGEQH